MFSRIVKPSFLSPALVLCAAMLYAFAAGAAQLPPQSSQAGGVSVSVKPVDISPAAKTWAFQVTLNTHSVDLSDDLARTAVIVDAAGKAHPAVGWEGSPPGGHHRDGVLKFTALSPRPDALQLRILRPGETEPRTFSWKLK